MADDLIAMKGVANKCYQGKDASVQYYADASTGVLTNLKTGAAPTRDDVARLMAAGCVLADPSSAW